MIYIDDDGTGGLQPNKGSEHRAKRHIEKTILNLSNLEPKTFGREFQCFTPKKLGPCLAPNSHNVIFAYLVLKSICCEDFGRLNGPSMWFITQPILCSSTEMPK
jgi:hypothetical protein